MKRQRHLRISAQDRDSSHLKQSTLEPVPSREARRTRIISILNRSFEASSDRYSEEETVADLKPEPVQISLPGLFRFFEYTVLRRLGEGANFVFFLAEDCMHEMMFLKVSKVQNQLLAYNREARFGETFSGRGKFKTKYAGFMSPAKHFVPLVKKAVVGDRGHLLYNYVRGKPLLSYVLSARKTIVNDQSVMSFRVRGNRQLLSHNNVCLLIVELCKAVLALQQQGLVHAEINHNTITAEVCRGEFKNIRILPSCHSLVLEPLRVNGHQLEVLSYPDSAEVLSWGAQNLPPETLAAIEQRALGKQHFKRIDRWHLGIYFLQLLSLTPLHQKFYTYFNGTFIRPLLSNTKSLAELIRRQQRAVKKIEQWLAEHDHWGLGQLRKVVPMLWDQNCGLQDIIAWAKQLIV